MKKLKLLGIKKSENYNYYIFPKEQKFFEIVRAILKDIGYPVIEWKGYGRPVDKKFREPIFSKEEKIEEYVDKMQNFGFKGKEHIEIIFGKDKVFLMIHTKKDKQQRFSKIIDKFIK